MATKLEKPLRRELNIDGKPYILTIEPRPQPEWPMMQTNSPLPIEKLMRSKIAVEPYLFERPCT